MAYKAIPPTVFVIAYWYDPRWTTFVGATVKVRDLAENFVRQGLRVVAFLPRHQFDAGRFSFRIIEVPFLNLPLVRFLSFNCFLMVILLREMIRQGADAFYIRRMGSFLPALLGKLAGVRIGYEINDNPFQGQYQEGSKSLYRLRRLLAVRMDLFNMHLADRLFVISEAVRDAIVHRTGARWASRLVLLPSGANTDLFHPAAKSTCRAALALQPGSDYVGFAGTLLDHQGLHVLVDAVPRVVAARPNCMFVLIGEGPMKPSLQEQATAKGLNDSIIFAGQVAYERMPVWIGAMDLCVAPYLRSAGLRSPVKLFDYLACQRPAVASDLPGTTDLFAASGAVDLVAPDDPDALAGAIIDLLERVDRRTEMGRRGRRFVVRHFDRRQMALKISRELQLT